MQTPRLFAVVFTVVALGNSLHAADAPLPNPGEVKTLAIHPAKVGLIGSDSAAQLVVTATLADGRQVDLTHDVKYAVADGKAATVLSSGRVLAARQRRDGDRRDVRRQVRARAARNEVDGREPAAQLRQPDRADLHQARLQLGRLPRQARGSERLPPLAARFRAGSRLHDSREGRPRPAHVPGEPGREPLPDEGDRPDRPRRRARRWNRSRTSTSSCAAGSRPACPGATRKTRPSPRSASIPNIACCRGRASNSSRSTRTTPTARSKTSRAGRSTSATTRTSRPWT